jgi:hypothetical protein
MSDPVSLRNIPAEVLHIAQALSTQSGLSVNAVLRLALASGILVEATKLPPAQDGTYGGVAVASLVRALRRHLGSAIDMLMEQGQHPYHLADPGGHTAAGRIQQEYAQQKTSEGNRMPFVKSMGEDLEALGIGLGLSDIIS